MRGSTKAQSRLLVAGLGNLLLKDDGVGVHVVRALGKRFGRRAIVAEVGTAVLSAMHLLERATKVLAIDAMQAGGNPGDIYLCRAADVAAPGRTVSAHELTLLSALEMIPWHKPEVWVLGVESDEIGFGLELTPEVAAALPRVIEQVEAFVTAPHQHLCSRLAGLGPHAAVLQSADGESCPAQARLSI